MKNGSRNYIINSRENIFNFSEKFNTLDLTIRQSIWCITGCGPFKSYLFKMKLADDDVCRFCYLNIETSKHLMFECDYLKDKILLRNDFDGINFEIIVRKLMKANYKRYISEN